MSGSNPNMAQTTGAEVKVLLKTNIGHRNIVWWLAEGEGVCVRVWSILLGVPSRIMKPFLENIRGKKVKNERV